jgi:hypothetical protein
MPYDGDTRAFWTLDAFMIRFAPSGAVAPPEVANVGGVFCVGVYFPDGKPSSH